jgi:lantibiotic modifying enzyme
MCLCHGTAGNLICLAKFKLGNLLANAMSEQLKSDLLHSGFSSMGAAQTMGIGLMTGLTGAGYYLISKDRPQVDFGFLSLS